VQDAAVGRRRPGGAGAGVDSIVWGSCCRRASRCWPSADRDGSATVPFSILMEVAGRLRVRQGATVRSLIPIIAHAAEACRPPSVRA